MVRLTDCPDMTSAVYHGRKTTTQQHATTVYSQIPMQVCNEILSVDKILTKFQHLSAYLMMLKFDKLVKISIGTANRCE